MKKTIPYWQMGGFIFTAVVGTLLHFFFDWTGGSVVSALFSAVNESIWEHLKLLFYPMVVFSLVEYYFWGKDAASFWCVKLLGIGLGLALIVVAYYTYTGALGVKADWLNIALFFAAAGVSYWAETKLLQGDFVCPVSPKAAVVVLCLLSALFTFFTFNPPRIPLFQDPLTGSYGFQG